METASEFVLKIEDALDNRSMVPIEQVVAWVAGRDRAVALAVLDSLPVSTHGASCVSIENLRARIESGGRKP